MGRLIYLTLTSLDGFIGDGDYSWSVSSPAFFGPGSYWSYATAWLFSQAS